MENVVYRKGMVLGIIILFIGASGLPIVDAVSQNGEKISNCNVGINGGNCIVNPVDKGSTVWDYIVGFICNLRIEENETSFTIIIAAGLRIAERDSGGFVAFVCPHFLERVCWIDEYEFNGTLLPHFIKGVVKYRIE